MRLLRNLRQGPLRALCVFLALIGPVPALSQQLGLPDAAILTISSDRLFAGSAFGRRVIDEIESEGAELAAENERIVADLSREEKELTEQRAEMTPEEFRELADAFDRKVQSHREGQRAKLEALGARGDEARGVFLRLARPILVDLLRESGAGVILERSSVFLSSDATDITDIAIARIDAEIGDGKDLE
ncbi:OmpH family outer membrane protein [Ruegeria sediminis]|uniref:OmpH family outer membrane protein n=2 Tax=Ruegeria sediminis TaxID=2583820 RepID=A0ABY2X1P4_9RHOB|nr:OmpH family outer membrane protein [Ruegeria sediminis]